MPVIEFKPLEGRRLDEIELGVYDAAPCDVEPAPVVSIRPPVTSIRPKNVLTARLEELYEECKEIARKKNADYASDENPFANFEGCTKYGISVPKGMLVRMEDKMQRISNLLDNEPAVAGESIYDTCRDLANYALILVAWLEKNKEPATEEVAGYHGC